MAAGFGTAEGASVVRAAGAAVAAVAAVEEWVLTTLDVMVTAATLASRRPFTVTPMVAVIDE